MKELIGIMVIWGIIAKISFFVFAVSGIINLAFLLFKDAPLMSWWVVGISLIVSLVTTGITLFLLYKLYQ